MLFSAIAGYCSSLKLQGYYSSVYYIKKNSFWILALGPLWIRHWQ